GQAGDGLRRAGGRRIADVNARAGAAAVDRVVRDRDVGDRRRFGADAQVDGLEAGGDSRPGDGVVGDVDVAALLDRDDAGERAARDGVAEDLRVRAGAGVQENGLRAIGAVLSQQRIVADGQVRRVAGGGLNAGRAGAVAAVADFDGVVVDRDACRLDADAAAAARRAACFLLPVVNEIEGVDPGVVI